MSNDFEVRSCELLFVQLLQEIEMVYRIDGSFKNQRSKELLSLSFFSDVIYNFSNSMRTNLVATKTKLIRRKKVCFYENVFHLFQQNFLNTLSVGLSKLNHL